MNSNTIVTITDPDDPEAAELPAVTSVLSLLEELGGNSQSEISAARGSTPWPGCPLAAWRAALAGAAAALRLLVPGGGGGRALLGPATGAERAQRCAGEIVTGLAVAVASDPLKPASELSAEDYQLVELEVGPGGVRGVGAGGREMGQGDSSARSGHSAPSRQPVRRCSRRRAAWPRPRPPAARRVHPRAPTHPPCRAWTRRTA
jgi:hypothetical protein